MVIFSAQLLWDVLGGGFGMLLLCFTDAVLFLLWGRVGTSHSASWGRAFPLGWGSGVTPRDGSYQCPTPADVIPGVPVTHQASLVSVCVTRTHPERQDGSALGHDSVVTHFLQVLTVPPEAESWDKGKVRWARPSAWPEETLPAGRGFLCRSLPLPSPPHA